jgi:5-methyltetrahydropteroyltriglutamate--homocysteine methyltransferase
MNVKQGKIMTAIVGSYPKAEDIFFKEGRALLDDCGLSFYDLERKFGKEEFQRRLDAAALKAITDQNDAGIDIVTDGEERREHYVLHVLRGLGGFDFEHRVESNIRGGTCQLPRAAGTITYRGPILIDEFLFTKKHAAGIAKINLPGPSTVVDSVVDDYYRSDREQMARDYATAIRQEVENLIKSGCRAIQFDDPVLLRRPGEAKVWGLDALQLCFSGIEDKALYTVHICRGYPNEDLKKKGIKYKADEDHYEEILSWLNESSLDVISIEAAQCNLDLSVLPAAGKKTVMLGILDVGRNDIESVESIVARGREALRYLPKRQLIIAPDCGMLELTQTAAKQKLSNMAHAAAVLNESF